MACSSACLTQDHASFYRCCKCEQEICEAGFYWRRTGAQAGKRITQCKPCYAKYNMETKLRIAS